ncbi:Tubulin-folding cofactor D [Camellia lanceoleosa]|uniref:Tubulin-folding cofactor D n=1 Tax=Camellia lanceoleosa TaxID=1840588 RepID=A0ACC0FR86_9ERIC|nr:Tubulin-folding cofactor D [Camellia lanceoleosa]
MRHGSTLAAGEVVFALHQHDYTLSIDKQKHVAGIVPAIEKARLYRGKGGEIMRSAVSRFIERISSAHVHWPEKLILSVQMIKVLVTDPNVAARRGSAFAIGVLPFELLAKRWKISYCQCYDWDDMPLFLLIKNEVIRLYLKPLDDYSVDNRGDVGSWVHEAAMDGLERCTYILCKRHSMNLSGKSHGVESISRSSRVRWLRITGCIRFDANRQPVGWRNLVIVNHLSGLVISIGGLQDFTKKASLTALLGYLQASESGKHNEQNLRV